MALAEWAVKMAKLEAEERNLRSRLKSIEAKRGVGEENVTDATTTSKQDHDLASLPSRIHEDGSKHEDQDTSEEPDTRFEEQYTPPLPALKMSEHVHLHLPEEIIIHIVDFVGKGLCAQQALHTCCMLSHSWYDAAVSLLYRRPTLTNKNFDTFTRAICPSINLHVRRSPLAELVRVLDLSRLAHTGSKSVTARLLGRTKGGLEEFVAPQASLSMHCLPALGKCKALRVLDLSLVTEAPALPELFKTIAGLDQLRTLRLPRSTGFGVHHRASSFSSGWPRSVQDLTLSGGIDAHFLHGVASLPSTLTSLTIEHCPLAKSHAINHLLRTSVSRLEQLKSLKIAHIPRLSSHALDDLLFILPSITKLSVSVDYITPSLFDGGYTFYRDDKTHPPTSPNHINLRTLELTSSNHSRGVEDKISPIDVLVAVEDGCLPALRRVRVAQSLGWHHSGTAGDTEALTDALQEGARRDWEGREWVFGEMRESEYAREKVWERLSGVWIFEG